MKFLLTSAGLTNKSISGALLSLVGKKAEEISIAFIPTAANIEEGDKDWLIDNLMEIKKQNFKSIDIVDISAVEERIWKPKFDEADVLFFGGGNTYYLMEWINKSGLAKILPELLKTKVWAGISAGSMVTNKDLSLKISQIVYEEDLDKEEMSGLNFVDFYFLPHLNSPYFPNLREKNIRDVAKDIPEVIYALDDSSALKVVDGNVEIISEGEYLVLNK